jgi:hypothetical protein
MPFASGVRVIVPARFFSLYPEIPEKQRKSQAFFHGTARGEKGNPLAISVGSV